MEQFLNKAVIRLIQMIFQNYQYMAHITEQIQVIRLCCFRYAVNYCAEFYTIDAIDQLPRMFMQTEAVEHSFCYVVVKWKFPIIQEHFQFFFLLDTVVDSFQYFYFRKTIGGPHFFCLCKESLSQRFDCHLSLLFPIIWFQIRQLIIQMIDGPDPNQSFIRNGIFYSYLRCFRKHI